MVWHSSLGLFSLVVPILKTGYDYYYEYDVFYSEIISAYVVFCTHMYCTVLPI